MATAQRGTATQLLEFQKSDGPIAEQFVGKAQNTVEHGEVKGTARFRRTGAQHNGGAGAGIIKDLKLVNELIEGLMGGRNLKCTDQAIDNQERGTVVFDRLPYKTTQAGQSFAMQY
ncbi:MAG: hypothetical protein NVS4B8_09350 [Herpetosiphon sp.]